MKQQTPSAECKENRGNSRGGDGELPKQSTARQYVSIQTVHILLQYLSVLYALTICGKVKQKCTYDLFMVVGIDQAASKGRLIHHQWMAVYVSSTCS